MKTTIPASIHVVLPVTGGPTIPDHDGEPFTVVRVTWTAYRYDDGDVITAAVALGADHRNAELWTSYTRGDLPAWAPPAPAWFDAAVEGMSGAEAVTA